jgi:hypothetical protein
MQNPDKIRSLLKDLREARQAKSREGLQAIDHNELSVSWSAINRDMVLTAVHTIATQSLRHGNQRNQTILREVNGDSYSASA